MHWKVDGKTCDDGGWNEVTTYTLTDWEIFETEHKEVYHLDDNSWRYIPEWESVSHCLCTILNYYDMTVSLRFASICCCYIKVYSSKIISKCLKNLSPFLNLATKPYLF